jgi:hypothetical protein
MISPTDRWERTGTVRKVTGQIGLLVCLVAVGWLPPSSLLGARTSVADDARSTGLLLLRSARQDSPESIGVEVDPAVYESMATRQRVVVRDFPLPGTLSGAR